MVGPKAFSSRTSTASSCTNTLSVRLPLPVIEDTIASAVYVQALDLTVRLDPTYRRIDEHHFDCSSEGDFHAVLE